MIDPTSRTPLSLGFIGGAVNSAVGYAHFVSCRMDNRWNVVAGCFSAHAEINARTGSAYGVDAKRVHADWTSLLRDEHDHLDAVLVVTPTPAHREMVGACLEAGIPVISEKALATNKQESAELLALRQETAGFLAVTYNYSGYPMMRELRAKIASGALGEILHFQAEMPQEGFARTTLDGGRPAPQEWRLHDGAVPTLALDLAVHLHHCVDFLIQAKPLSVVADQSTGGWFRNIVDDFVCIARYERNIRGQIWFSKSSLGHRNGLRLRIYGSKASAEWYQANPEELHISHIDGRREILDRGGDVTVASLERYNRFKVGHPAGFVEAFANLYVDLADSLLAFSQTGRWDAEDVYGVAKAHEGLSLLDAMETSASTSMWCEVSSQ
jgi:predicted dehydrogenase